MCCVEEQLKQSDSVFLSCTSSWSFSFRDRQTKTERTRQTEGDREIETDRRRSSQRDGERVTDRQRGRESTRQTVRKRVIEPVRRTERQTEEKREIETDCETRDLVLSVALGLSERPQLDEAAGVSTGQRCSALRSAPRQTALI